jgi:hypothetical protein
VWSPRAQCDKQQYRLKMRQVLESEPAEVAELIVEPRATSHEPRAITPGDSCDDRGPSTPLRSAQDDTLERSDSGEERNAKSAWFAASSCAMAARSGHRRSSSPRELFSTG